jgi:hypothetical protein
MARLANPRVEKVFKMAAKGVELHATWLKCGRPTTWGNVLRKWNQQQGNSSTATSTSQRSTPSPSSSRTAPRSGATSSTAKKSATPVGSSRKAPRSATFGPPTAPEPTLLSKIISRLRGHPNVVRANGLYPWVYGVCGTGESWARIAD